MTNYPVDKGFIRLVTSLGEQSQTVELNSRQEVAIGRDPSCQIILDSLIYSGVSRRHAAVCPLAEAGSWKICDLKSANGTYVNNQRISGCQILQPGDRIVLGQNIAELVFEVQGTSPPTQASAPRTTGSVSLTQLLPIISTGPSLIAKAYLLPGIVTVVFVVSMFAMIGNFVAFALLLAAYLSGAAFYFVYQLCGKYKPWWLLLAAALLTILMIVSPVLHAFIIVFRDFLPGDVASLPSNANFFSNLITHFFGAGLLEELLKALPVFAAYFLGLLLSYPWRQRIGVCEPLDGILLGSASAVGFTLIETLGQYVPGIVIEVTRQSGKGFGQLAGLQLLIPRVLGSVAGHMAYSGYFGYFIGLSVLRPKKRWRILLIGYLSASMLHALWNSSRVLGSWVLALVGALSYAFLAAAILKARELSPTRSHNFATGIKS
ncbi:MAG: PrsW family intramembrane metalloprotease [Hormoscilla sp. GM102CHS1]|nr:PrsW family intramembrane metalloprotease [Hormoscilla sp. GM102CHS1]